MDPREPKDSDITPIDLAARVADGGDVDWATPPDPADAAVVEQLKRIAAVAALHRRPADASEASGAPADAATGGLTTWGPLSLLAKIGSGRFGDVYRAWDARLHRLVALKLLHMPASTTAGAPTRAIEEARLLARVRHPNVLTVHGAECIDDRIGIWTELIDGQTLEALLAAVGPLPADEVIAIGIDLARALAAVHDNGTLHRDVKAQNVMRETGGRIVLMDFGTGLDLDNGSAVPGDLSGTPLYLAPELFNGGVHTVASDVYALAVLLCYLLTGRHPIGGRTLDDVRQAHTAGAAQPVRALSADAPEPLVAAIERGLDADPLRRFATAQEFEQALVDARSVMTGVAPTLPVTARGMSARARAALAVGAAVVATAATWWIASWASSSGRGPSPVVCENCTDEMSGLSADGSQLAFTNNKTHDIEIRDLQTMSVRPLSVLKGIPIENGPLADQGTFSRDGRYLAYRLRLSINAPWQLLMIDLRAGSAAVPRTLIDGEQGRVWDIHDWSKDGSAVLVSLAGRTGGPPNAPDCFAWVSIADGAVREIKWYDMHRLEIRRPARVSPDGRHIVYAGREVGPKDPPVRTSTNRHLMLMATDGSDEKTIVGTATANTDPLWSPDGTQVLYTSDQAGVVGLWSVAVSDGRATGSAMQLKPDVGLGVAMQLTRDGVYYYARYPPLLDQIFFADPRTHAVVQDERSTIGGRRPIFSPDGTRLLFVRTRETGENSLISRVLATGAEQMLVQDKSFQPKAWFSDGLAVLLQRTGETNPELFRLTPISDPVKTGKDLARSLLRMGTLTFAKDDRTIYTAARLAGSKSATFDRIIAVDIVTGSDRLVFMLPGDAKSLPTGGGIGLDVSPDGRTLAVAMWSGYHAKLFTVGTDGSGSDYREIVHSYWADSAIDKVKWTDHGASILYAAGVGSPETGTTSWRIMRVPAAGGTSEMIVEIGGHDITCTFDPNPDGTLIAFHPYPTETQAFNRAAGLYNELRRIDLGPALKGAGGK